MHATFGVLVWTNNKDRFGKVMGRTRTTIRALGVEDARDVAYRMSKSSDPLIERDCTVITTVGTRSGTLMIPVDDLKHLVDHLHELYEEIATKPQLKSV